MKRIDHQNDPMVARLHVFFKTLNLRQKHLIRDLGISRAFASGWFNGARFPGRLNLRDMIEKYNLNVNWLLSGKGEMFLK